MESCARNSFEPQPPVVVGSYPVRVYVCLNCGRCSCDRQGHQPLASGWSVSCTRSAVRFALADLNLSAQGIVSGIRLRAIEAIRSRALAAVN